MATITVIPANNRFKGEGNGKTIRVAAYCRVSTDRDAQESSYEIQRSHYQELIEKTPAWTLAGIYADEGISGTSVKHREQFRQMIQDAEAGLIDLIVTKSISRFARNTVDCLGYARMLKSFGVPVYFEKENINTMDAGGEFLLTVMASLAQQESISLSQNVKLGLQYRYQQGKVTMGFSRFLGYDRNESGDMVVVPEEAEIIKSIFNDFIEKKSYGDICKGLTEKGIQSPSGGSVWYKETIVRMLKNEKYAGDAILQKTYTTDVLNKVREVNAGYVPQYYIRDHHEPVVSHEIWLRAQAEMMRRAEPESLYRLFCGKCKMPYRVYRGEKLMCSTRIIKGPRKCANDIILLDEHKEVIVKALNEVIVKGASFDVPEIDYERLYMSFTDLTILAIGRRAHEMDFKDIEKEKDELLSKILRYEAEKEAVPRLNSIIASGGKVSLFREYFFELVRMITYHRNRFSVTFAGGETIEVKKDGMSYPVRKPVRRKKR